MTHAPAPKAHVCGHHSPDSGTLQRAAGDRSGPPICCSANRNAGPGDFWHPGEWDSYDAAEKARPVAAFNAGESGFGLSVGPGFGSENEQPFECHIKMMTKQGIWNIENLDFSQLLADNVSEFLFVWSPLKMKGGTGSPGNPVALF